MVAPGGPDGVPAAWRFVGGADRPRPHQDERFAADLRERLRIAHALGVGLELRWSTGATGGLVVRPLDRSSSAWWRGQALSLYPPTRWRAERAVTGGEPPELWVGAARAGAEAPFRAAGPPPWSDAAATALGELGPGVTVRWVLRPAGTGGSFARRDPRLVRRLPGYAAVPAPPASRPERALEDERALRGLEARWLADVRVLGRGRPEVGAAAARILEAAGRRDGGNGLRFRRAVWWRRPLHVGPVLSTDEAVELLPSPWSPWAEGPSAPAVAGAGALRLGRDPAGFPVELPIEARNGRHLLVTGETGMGKSTFLVRLAIAAARHGAVLLLDPLGETGRELAEHLSDRGPTELLRISPQDAPVAANALAVARGPRPQVERAIADLVDALRRVRSARFASAPFWGPRVEEALAWAIEVAAAAPSGTLVDAARLLEDPESWGGPTPGREAEVALRSLRDRARRNPEEIEGARRVLAEATRSAVLRHLLADPAAGWPLSERLRPGRVTVVTGDAGAVGEAAARTLLSLYLALLWTSLLARPEPSPVFLLLDEAPWYANDALVQMFRIGRRLGLHTVVAAQSLRAFPEELREALLTNASDQVRFRGSPAEAEELERWGVGLTTEQLVGLPRGIAAALLGKGGTLRWLRVDPLPAPSPSAGPRAVPAPAPLPLTASSEVPAARAREALRRTLEEVPGDGARTLALAAWRSDHALSPAEVRRLGQELARAGALRSERVGGATRWTIDVPAALRHLRPGPADARDATAGTGGPRD